MLFIHQTYLPDNICFFFFFFVFSCVKEVVKGQFKDDFEKLFKHLASDNKKVCKMFWYDLLQYVSSH